VVWDKGFLGVVADKEWDAIKASQQLKVEWSEVKPPFVEQAVLFDHIRKAPVRKREVDAKQTGNVEEAFRNAARVIEAEYEWPFQSHACMGPACALVEIDNDGNVTCWTGSQKPHFVQNGISRTIGVPPESYEFANKRTAWETIPPLLDRGSPLRSSHLRDPVGPQVHFASESFMDEVAAALNLDPIAFRLKHLKAPRDIAVIKAAAEKAGWQPRPSPRRDQVGNTVSGRGFAYSQRNGTLVAIVAEVEIDRTTGKIWARKFTV